MNTSSASMKKFETKVSQKADQTFIKVIGYLDEHASLPKELETREVLLDLDELTGLNSVGTKIWIGWFKDHFSVRKMSLFNCPPLFVKSMNRVEGMLPKRFEVKSFYIPYIHDETGARKDILVDTINLLPALKMQEQYTDAQGLIYELDVMQDYLTFSKS